MALPKEKEAIQTLTESSPSYLKSKLPPLNLGGDLVTSVQSYVQACREIIYQEMDEGTAASRLVRLQSLMMDQLITRLYHRGFEASQSGSRNPVTMTLFAQGGYGRAELNLFSDLDLLFIYEGKDSSSLEAITKQMLYPLWDAKIQVGYSIRTISKCAKVMANDVRVMSSILDARYLGGDSKLASKFFRFLETRISSGRTLKKFVRAKLKETKDRFKKFGTSVYVTEPNLKESEGGLRDWHTLLYFVRMASKTSNIVDWVRSGFMSNEEAEQLNRALEFIWELRNRLHRLAGKEQDQLIFEFQETIAQDMGFENDGRVLGVEKFMQAYYGHASNLFRLRREVTRRILAPPKSFYTGLKNRLRPSLSGNFVNNSGRVSPKSFRKLEDNPKEIVTGFWLAQKKQLDLDDDFKSWVHRHLNLVDDAFRKDPEVCRLMRELFDDVPGIGHTLWEMHDCRFLGVMIPEFGEILHQTQHDVYHVYTVDTHSIQSVREVSDLKKGEYDKEFPAFAKALGEVKDDTALVLGVLFHDIGKGKGGGHPEVGARLARAIMKRLGYEEECITQVEFLVLSHLIMPHLSQRRDLEDAVLIEQFSQTMENLENLNQLFILTWADIRAVGPDVWTPWKGDLLRDLYNKTRTVLETGEYSHEKAVDVMARVKKKVLKTAPKRFSQEQLSDFIDSMPPRYFLVNQPEQIMEHFEHISKAEEPEIVLFQVPNLKGNYNELTIFTGNSARLFEQVTGVLASNQINILSLEQFYNNRGEALLQLKVTDRRGFLLDEERRFKILEKELGEILREKVPLDVYMESHRGSAYFQKTKPVKPPRVEIDKDISPYYTVIDIYADDRIGLLNDLARAIRELNLYVEVSKISTKVDQASDAFYVKDVFGHKIKEGVKLKAIRDKFMEVLTQESGG